MIWADSKVAITDRGMPHLSSMEPFCSAIDFQTGSQVDPHTLHPEVNQFANEKGVAQTYCSTITKEANKCL